MHRTLIAALVSILPAVALADTPAPPKVGDTIADIELRDVSGETRKLSVLAKDRPAAIIFIATRCPYSNAYNDVMVALDEKYGKKIAIVGINSNETEPLDSVAKHTKENGFAFTVLKDPGSKIANRFGARFTPEVYLVDAGRKLVYHGTIGNSGDPTANPEVANSEELTATFGQLLADAAIDPATRKAFGCSIKR